MTKEELWDNIMSIYLKYGNEYSYLNSNISILSEDNKFICKFWIDEKNTVRFTLETNFSFTNGNEISMINRSHYTEEFIFQKIKPILRDIKLQILLNS
jgi:hypothetical protein